MTNDNEAQEMSKRLREPAPPSGRGDMALVRGREGTYWLASDGLRVQVAAAETAGIGARDAARGSEARASDVIFSARQALATE